MGSVERNLAVVEPNTHKMITPAGTIEDAVEQFKVYQELKEKLGTEDDFQPIAGKKHPKKSFVRKVQKFFNLSCEILRDEPLKDEGKIIAWVATVRATHLPTGAYQDADGSCSFDEKVDKQQTIHNIRAHAITRAKNRAILDLVGFGEVSAEELPLDGSQGSGGQSKNGNSSKEMTYEQAANMVINFGQHKGSKLRDIPDGYLEWLVKNARKDELKRACVMVLDGPPKSSAEDWQEVDDEDLPFTMDDEDTVNDADRYYCCECGIEITKARATLSEHKYGKRYCITCKM